MIINRHCKEKFRAARYHLAVGEGDVRSRLRRAYRYLNMLDEHEVPESLYVVIDGVFEVAADAANEDPAAPLEVSLGTPALRFHPASEPDQAAIAQVQASTRERILRAFSSDIT